MTDLSRCSICCGYDVNQLVSIRNSCCEFILCKECQIKSKTKWTCPFCNQFLPKSDKEHYRRAKIGASKGNLSSIYKLGVLSKYGCGTIQSDERAFNFFSIAAMKGLAVAQHEVGVCYDAGLGIEPSQSQAFLFYSQAAEQGFPISILIQGNCFFYGKGIAKSSQRAVQCWEKAAEKGGLSCALYQLANCYLFGEGVTRCEKKAFHYFSLSAKKGHSGAIKERTQLFSSMASTDENELLLPLDIV